MDITSADNQMSNGDGGEVNELARLAAQAPRGKPEGI